MHTKALCADCFRFISAVWVSYCCVSIHCCLAGLLHPVLLIVDQCDAPRAHLLIHLKIAVGQTDRILQYPTFLVSMSVPCARDCNPESTQWKVCFVRHQNCIPQKQNKKQKGETVKLQFFFCLSLPKAALRRILQAKYNKIVF